MDNKFITLKELTLILIPFLAGIITRLTTLKEDLRQYPSFPNGYMIHIVTGVVAAALGSVAVPSLINKNFVAVTWLAIALQQFRDIRKIEKESLSSIEDTESVIRGSAYIDGIAKTYEARNYITFAVSLISSISVHGFAKFSIPLSIIITIVIAAVCIYLLKRFSKGKTVGDIASIKKGTIEIKGSELFVDGIFVTNVLGTDNSQELFKSEGIAAVISPNEDHFRITLDNYGQRQAILFEATRAMGLKRYAFTRKDYDKGRIVVAFVPIIKDVDRLIKIITETPILESVKKSHSVIKTKLTER